MISSTNPALTPPPDATVMNPGKVQIDREVESALVVKNVAPSYPDDRVKIAHDQGKVILRTSIGTEGRVQDVRLVSAHTPSLALAAFLSVSQWKLKPYRIEDKSVMAKTTVEVDFLTKEEAALKTSDSPSDN
ncbi:MAG: energy transducer TonB [Terracidiphilus sp.]